MIILTAATVVMFGVLNPAVTQATIHSTICVKGWTKTVRPPVKYTNALKKKLLIAAGIPVKNSRLYELDHEQPLELGGHPTDPRNLKLQIWTGLGGAHDKDTAENALHIAVCAGRMTLAEGQAAMSTWIQQHAIYVEPK